jgi:hypothetical protein
MTGRAHNESDLMSKPTKPNSGNSNPRNAKPGTASAAAAKPGTAQAKRAQSKKIVNKRQTPWALIVTTVVIVALAAGIVGYAVTKVNKKTASANPNKIAGIAHYTGLTRKHVDGVVSYPQSPPVGGNHSPIWADCNGVIYPNQIANENAVHPLEHGAVWITYKPGLDAADLDTLTKYVAGQQYIFMTPYAGLKTNISLQAWGYQLFLNSAKDPRIKQFITDLRLNQTNTPELGASCDSADTSFETTPSTPGHPIDS